MKSGNFNWKIILACLFAIAGVIVAVRALNRADTRGDLDARSALSDDEIAEIERHKYFLSERAGYDVGWEYAQEDWNRHYAEKWRCGHRERDMAASDPQVASRQGPAAQGRVSRRAASESALRGPNWLRGVWQRWFQASN